jgi:serine/threonine protein kinase
VDTSNNNDAEHRLERKALNLQVYRAFVTGIHHMGAVAVATASAMLTSELLEREGQVLSKLSHPHIITMHGYCENPETKGLHGLILEVCDCGLADVAKLQSQTSRISPCKPLLTGSSQQPGLGHCK